MKEKEIKVLMVEPGKSPSATTIVNELNSLQEAVSKGADSVGLIEIFGIDDNVCILCNEEGKLIGLEPNRRFYNDVLVGTFYVIGEDCDGNLTSLPQKYIDYYTDFFSEIEDLAAEDVERATVIHFFAD